MIALNFNNPIALPDSTDKPAAKTGLKLGGFEEALSGLLGKKHTAEDDQKLAVPSPTHVPMLLDLKTLMAKAQAQTVEGQANVQAHTQSVGAQLIAGIMSNVANEPLGEAIDEAFRDNEAALPQELAAKLDTQAAPKVEHTQTASAPQPVFKSELVDAIAKHVVAETPKVEITVMPPELGKVRVSVEVRQNEVHVRVQAENNDVAKSIQDRLPELQQTLREQGMRVGSVDVGMQSMNTETSDFSQNRGGNGAFEREQRDSGHTDQRESAAPIRAARPSIKRSKVDVIV